VYIDKGEHDGIKPDMAVITSDGVVGKVLRVYRSTALVLLIDDQTSGVGSILDKTRLQGILRGTPSGEVVLEKVMSDETVPTGELVLTSGGDGIFPKGLVVGHVTKVTNGSELFLNIRVHPSVNLNRLEEVLVVMKIDERQSEPDHTGAARAVDILAERLPGVPSKPESAAKDAAGGVAQPPAGNKLGTAAQTTVTPNTLTPHIVTPNTITTKPVVPGAAKSMNTAPAAKPIVPPQATVSGAAPTVGKSVATPAHAGPGPNTVAAKPSTSDSTKTNPNSAKASPPKPRPPSEDTPH
jgi:rod shape-determining protein MreC